ncbi:MAG: hypothetical protein QXZ09_09645 [Candidatus Methanomethylicaceae archaeon]
MDYLESLSFEVENRGAEPVRIVYDDRTYEIRPGQRSRIPAAVALHALGDWGSSGEYRRREHERCRVLWGQFSGVDRRDLENIKNKVSTVAAAKQAKLGAKGIDRLMDTDLPVPPSVPELVVYDDEGKELPREIWPLYQSESEPKRPESQELAGLPADVQAYIRRMENRVKNLEAALVGEMYEEALAEEG